MDTPKKLGRPCATSMGDDVASLGFGDESFDANESFTTEEEAMSAAGSGAGWAHPGHHSPTACSWHGLRLTQPADSVPAAAKDQMDGPGARPWMDGP